MILLLGGTAEGKELARVLANAGARAIVSLAGATRSPAPQALEVISGGFGGETGFLAFLETRGITAVIDATHPFAARITERTARVCAARGLPYLRLQRPAWAAEAGDIWHDVATEAEVSALVSPGQVVFLATGRQTLERFAGLREATLICRQIDPPDSPFPFPNGRFLVGRPPFSHDQEVALFRSLAVDWLVVKNAGGAASATKLSAARALKIPVAMVARPNVPPGVPVVHTVAEALSWILAK